VSELVSLTWAQMPDHPDGKMQIAGLVDNCAPISLVQQTLGHGSIKTTSLYAHAKPGDSSALYLKKVRD
jgi:hypothetical protein